MITAETSFDVDADSYTVCRVEAPRLKVYRRPSLLSTAREKSTSDTACASRVFIAASKACTCASEHAAADVSPPPHPAVNAASNSATSQASPRG